MPRLDPDHPGAQSDTHVYILARCPDCLIDYAILPDPAYPFMSQYLFFERLRSMEAHTHICTGGFLCLRGHQVTLIGQGVLADEHWYLIPNFNPDTARAN